MQPRILLLLMSMVVLSPMAIDIYLASMPQMVIELNASTSQVQSTIALFFFAMGLGQIFVGPLADRYGRRPVVICGLFLYLLSSLAAAFVNDIWLMQGCRLLQGLAACAISVVIFSVVRDRYNYAKSSKIYSYLNGVLSVIPAFAPIFGSLLASYFGWRSTFVFMFAYSLLVLLLIYRYLPETLTLENTSTTTRLYDWQRYLSVLSSKCFVYYALCSMAAMAAILSYVSYAPVWLIDHLGLSATVFSLLFGLNACMSIIVSFCAPILITRLGNRRVVKLALSSMLIAALLLLVLALFFVLEGLLAGVAFMLPVMFLSAGLSLLLGPATSMALSEFADKAATASALLGFIQMVGASIVVMLIQQTSFSAPVAVAIVLLSLVVPLLLMMSFKCFAQWYMERSVS